MELTPVRRLGSTGHTNDVHSEDTIHVGKKGNTSLQYITDAEDRSTHGHGNQVSKANNYTLDLVVD